MAKSILATVLVLITGITYPSQQTDHSARLDSVLENVKSHLAQQKPKWKHCAIEPIKGSKNVLVNNWVFEDQCVRISFTAYGSPEHAAEAMRRALTNIKPEQKLPELGDGGYSFGFKDSSICFWRADIGVCVSSSTQSAMEFATLAAAAITAG